MKWMNIFVVGAVMLLSACGDIRDSKTVRASEDFYFTYINRPKVMHLEDADTLKHWEENLSTRFVLLDKELTELTRSMDSILDPSNPNTVAALLQTYPWLSNAMVLDNTGLIMAAIPASVPAFVDFSYLNSIEDIKSRDVYGSVVSYENQNYMLVARPYVRNGTLIGYLAVTFDPRALLPLIGDAGSTFISTIDTVLWSGDIYLPDTPIGAESWQQRIDKESFGVLDFGGQKAAWVVRYYANMPLIYGAVVDAYEPSKESE